MTSAHQLVQTRFFFLLIFILLIIRANFFINASSKYLVRLPRDYRHIEEQQSSAHRLKKKSLWKRIKILARLRFSFQRTMKSFANNFDIFFVSIESHLKKRWPLRKHLIRGPLSQQVSDHRRLWAPIHRSVSNNQHESPSRLQIKHHSSSSWLPSHSGFSQSWYKIYYRNDPVKYSLADSYFCDDTYALRSCVAAANYKTNDVKTMKFVLN